MFKNTGIVKNGYFLGNAYFLFLSRRSSVKVLACLVLSYCLETRLIDSRPVANLKVYGRTQLA